MAGVAATGAAAVGVYELAAGTTVNLRLGLHGPHGGGPHQFLHLQLNMWKEGIKNSDKAWRQRIWK